LSYDAAHHRWEGYCSAAGVNIGIHQLRHAHATELKVSGVALYASFGRFSERWPIDHRYPIEDFCPRPAPTVRPLRRKGS
jgi:integrase